MFLDRGILAVEGNQHIAFASDLGRREVHIGGVCINRLVSGFSLARDQVNGHLLVISLKVEIDIKVSLERMGSG